VRVGEGRGVLWMTGSAVPVSDRQLGITESPKPPNVRSPKADRSLGTSERDPTLDPAVVTKVRTDGRTGFVSSRATVAKGPGSDPGKDSSELLEGHYVTGDGQSVGCVRLVESAGEQA
jgi:hypothetical protein